MEISVYPIIITLMILLSGCNNSNDCELISNGGIVKKKCCISEQQTPNLKKCTFYNEKGQVIKEGYYKNNLPTGYHRLYSDGRLYAIREYVIVEDTISYENCGYVISPEGDTILEKSNFYEMSYPKLVHLGDTVVANISIKAPIFKHSKLEAIVQEPHRGDTIRLIRSLDLKHQYKYKALYKGENEILFELKEIEFIKEKDDWVTSGDYRLLYAKMIFNVE